MADFLKPDLCVLGSGSLGTALAIKARQAGLDVILVRLPRDEENDPTAGHLRRAAFLASAARAQALRHAGKLGLSNAEPKPNFRAIGERAAAIAEALGPRDSDDRLTALDIKVLADDAAFLDRTTLRCGEAHIRAGQFVLAFGEQSDIPALPGLDQVPFFTPLTIADNMRKLSHLVVIGGTPEAFELAQAYVRLGSMVTLVPQGGLLPGFDSELVNILLRDLREEGLTVLDDATVTAIQPRSQGTGVVLARASGEDHLDVSHILVAMSGRPDLDAGLLDLARLKRDSLRPDQLQLGPDGQTSNNRVSAIGAAAGRPEPHIGTLQLNLMVERLSRRGKGQLDPRLAPRMVLTEPPLAQLGLLETDRAPRAGQTVLRTNLAEGDHARANAASNGAAKLMVDTKGNIAGAGAVGPGAGDLMTTLALVLTQGLKLPKLSQLAPPQSGAAAALVELADQFLLRQPRTGLFRRRH